MNKEKIAIVILNYQTWEETIEQAEAVRDLFDLKWEQIIVVDNASPNESACKLMEKDKKDYMLICSDTNKGYASGNNIGIRYARRKGFRYVWILNNDVLLEDERLLRDMTEIFEKDDSVAVVNPDIYSPEGRLFNRDSKRYDFYDLTIGIFSYRKRGRKIDELDGYGYIYRPQGCCMMLDLNKLEKAGDLDEHTFLYCEEIILAEKLRAFHYHCACLLNHKVIHNHSKTVKSVFKRSKWNEIYVESYKYYLKKYRYYNECRVFLCIIFWRLKNILLTLRERD